MKQSSVDALIHTAIILGVIAGIPLLGYVLIFCLTELLWANPTNVSIEWLITEDMIGGSPVNPFFISIVIAIMLIAGSIGLYLESNQSIETKKEDKK